MKSLPTTLLGGRIRTSTAGLTAAFLAVLTLWILVRPQPADVTTEVVTVRTTKRGAEIVPTPSPEPTASPVATPAATPAATPKPRRSAPPTAPTPAAPGVTPAPPPVGLPLPTDTPAPLAPAAEAPVS